MATYRDIDARLEAAGLEHYNIDHERGVAARDGDDHAGAA